MAYYFLFPEKDTTLYSQPDRTKLNAGSDEILEIVKERGSTDNILYPSRILIKFKNEDIQDTIKDIIGSTLFNASNTKVNLQLTATEPKNLLSNLNLNLYAVSQSWDEGTGRYSNLPTSSNGASWSYRDNDISKTFWVSGSSSIIGLTYGSSSLNIKEIPSGSSTELTINGVDFVPVTSASLFDSNDSEVFVNISSSIDLFGVNLQNAINASSSLTSVTASFDTDNNRLILSGSNIGAIGNVTITTSSIDGNDQNIFSHEHSASMGTSTVFNTQGGTDLSSTFNPGTSGSIKGGLGIDSGGGTWFTGSGFYDTEQYIVGNTLDTNFNVLDIVKKFSASLFSNQSYPDGIENEGFIIKKPDAIENDISHSFGQLQYFSVDTHTIHPPKLTFKWSDSEHNYQPSASLSGDLNVSLYRNKKEYNQNDVATFRVHIRDRYPTRSFTTTSNYLNPGWFTTGSYYSIRDAHTEQEIIPFDDYTLLSADSEGMYFKIYMKGLQPERYYRVLFKHINNDGTTIYDNDYYFKVIR